MAILNNIPALGNSMLQKPLAGALNRAAAQNQQFYANQPNLTQMAQEERLRQNQDGLNNVQNSRKKKLKDKALKSPMLGMSEAASGTQSTIKAIQGSVHG